MSKNTFDFTSATVSISLSNDRFKSGVVMTKQCHKDNIVDVMTGLEDTTDCDALVTQNKDIKLGIYTADCAPIVYSDGRTIGVAHAGWRGLCLGLAQKMLTHFDVDNLEVFVGPHLHVFEIKKDACYETILATFGKDFFEEKTGKIFFKYKDAVASCLPPNVVFDERSTDKDLTLPSNRRHLGEERIITVVQFTN